jgi:hypothetical protein
MSDRWADTDAFTEAKKTVERLGAEAARQVEPQAFTLLRFSQAKQLQRGTQPDLLKQPVGADFVAELSKTLTGIKLSQTAAGPLGAIEAIGNLIDASDGERHIVYVVSDFRAREWNEPTELRKELTQLNQADAEIHLIHCVDRARPNLAITSLAPADGVRAAGEEWFMEVAVRNFGASAVREVPVLLTEDGHARPGVTIAEIPPGQTVMGRLRVNFSNAGPHQIAARLESDAVAADNYRYCVVNLPADIPVLLIDGDPQARDAWFLNLALSPGGAVRTGIRPQIESPRYLSTQPLSPFRIIYLMNIDRLEQSGINALEKFAADGGGVVFFVGQRCQARFFNDALYRDGQGLFPVPLDREAELPIDRLEPAPDVQFDKHFIFRVFSEKRNALLQTIAVRRYFGVPRDWRPAPDSTTRVIASLRNGAPLIVERQFGEGRVVAMLTTAAPTWNTWAKDPSFVVVMQELRVYLAQRSDKEASRLVGEPLELSLDASRYNAQVRFATPDESGAPAIATDAVPDADGTLVATLADTNFSGFYEAQLSRTDGKQETRHFAVNVDPAEGDLAMLDAEQLASRLEGVKYRDHQASLFQFAAGDQPGHNLGEALLYALVLLLIGEQALAWSTGYHPVSRPAAPQQGGAA